MQGYPVLAKLLFCQHDTKTCQQWGEKGNTEGSLCLFFSTLFLGFNLLFSSSARKNVWKIDGRKARTEVWLKK